MDAVLSPDTSVGTKVPKLELLKSSSHRCLQKTLQKRYQRLSTVQTKSSCSSSRTPTWMERLSKFARDSFEAAEHQDSWAGYWAGFNLMRNFDAGYTDHNTGRFCLHPRFLEPEFTTSSQSADDAQVEQGTARHRIRQQENQNASRASYRKQRSLYVVSPGHSRSQSPRSCKSC